MQFHFFMNNIPDFINTVHLVLTLTHVYLLTIKSHLRIFMIVQVDLTVRSLS